MPPPDSSGSCRRLTSATASLSLVAIDGRPVVLVRHRGEFFAVQLQPQGLPAFEAGFDARDSFVCASHNGCFDVRTGAAVALPATEPVETFPTRIGPEGRWRRPPAFRPAPHRDRARTQPLGMAALPFVNWIFWGRWQAGLYSRSG